MDLLRDVYQSLNDGNGILDFSLESDGISVWTEDGAKFKIIVKEENSDEV